MTMLTMVLVFSLQANAALENRGTDSLGNRLIYDSDLNITWYDYSSSNDTWQNQMDWADALSVDFDGNVYDDWRLPSTVDGPYVFGFDGTTTGGFNITSSEMGHLYYTELGNLGYYNTSGNPTGCSSSWPYCLTNTGPFTDLQPVYYHSGTEYADYTDNAWAFLAFNGSQFNYNKEDADFYALAVRPGNVVPEPISATLFVVGGATLVAWRNRYAKKKG